MLRLGAVLGAILQQELFLGEEGETGFSAHRLVVLLLVQPEEEETETEARRREESRREVSEIRQDDRDS